jgi:hypothetical protein
LSTTTYNSYESYEHISINNLFASPHLVEEDVVAGQEAPLRDLRESSWIFPDGVLQGDTKEGLGRGGGGGGGGGQVGEER